jgi:hypothetical protein
MEPKEGLFRLCAIVTVGFLCLYGDNSVGAAGLGPNVRGWDQTKYISVDEVEPGMEAYCLTVYKGTQIEKFALEVIGVSRSTYPWLGHDIILVRGTDERFIETGPVGGCSGSPVYINGRMAGALAYAWTFSKDPLYGVTSIQEMLAVPESSGPEAGLVFDLSEPIDFEQIDSQLSEALSALAHSPAVSGSGFQQLPCPLITAGLPSETVQELDGWVQPLGFMAAAIMPGQSPYGVGATQLAPGACLAVPLVTGDMNIQVIGTVTEVVDDQVYGFGHGFLSYGAIDLPMATGHIHTVVSNVVRSFKYGGAIDIVGALTMDESTAVYGRLGKIPRTVPLTINVDRYNDAQTRVFDCRLATNQIWTPLLLRLVLDAAGHVLGRLPPRHTVQYKVTVGLEDAEPITFSNLSTGSGLAEVALESRASVALLMNNPYEKINVESVEIDIDITAEDALSRIWSVNLSDQKVKAGEEIEFEVVLQSVLTDKKKYQGRLRIPKELKPGKYDLHVFGGYDYLRFLQKAAPFKFIPENLPSLIEALNNVLRVKRDRLYCLLVLPPGGVALERAELPDLPPTKALVLRHATRMIRAVPYHHWLQKSFHTGTVVMDKKAMKITVEK